MVYDNESAQTACRNEMNFKRQICIALMDIQPFVDNCALDVVVIKEKFKHRHKHLFDIPTCFVY